jgi:hypothetical protein
VGRANARTRWATNRAPRPPLVPRMLRSAPHQTLASFPYVQLHIVDAPPTSGLPEVGNMVVQVGNSRLGCAGPESILPIVVMDSGLAPSGAPRNDGLISILDTSGALAAVW